MKEEKDIERDYHFYTNFLCVCFHEARIKFELKH
jgi:hypothetical protein